jgi:large subunit ribosomal protein L7A
LELRDTRKLIGVKQSGRALREGSVRRAFFAEDAEDRLIKPLQALCDDQAVPYERIPSMQELGRACGIEVGAAAVVILS